MYDGLDTVYNAFAAMCGDRKDMDNPVCPKPYHTRHRSYDVLRRKKQFLHGAFPALLLLLALASAKQEPTGSWPRTSTKKLRVVTVILLSLFNAIHD